MVAIVFAIGSMLCAAVNDLIFKLYSHRKGVVGFYMAIVGAIWASIFAGLVFYNGNSELGTATLKWGIISGVFSALANVLLIEAMAKHEVGICATIYRLNLAPAAILAFVFLGEPVTSFKLLGIGAAIVGVLIFSDMSSQGNKPRINFAQLIIVIAALLRACMGITYKYGLSIGGNTFQILTVNGLVWLIVGLIYTFVFEKKALKMTRVCVGYGLLSGVLVSGIVLFMMLALERGQASIVLPVAQLSFLVTSLIGVVLLREALTIRKIVGLSMALVCILFMALS